MEDLLSELYPILARTPATLAALLGGLPESLLNHRVAEGTFSPRDVVGHLIHGERTDWVPRISHILKMGDSKPFTPFDRTGFRDEGQPMADLLAEFRALRTEGLGFLTGLALAPDELELRGLHPELGTVTLGQLLATWAVHDLNHLDQIARVISRRHEAAVGPWKAYLGILNR